MVRQLVRLLLALISGPNGVVVPAPPAFLLFILAAAFSGEKERKKRDIYQNTRCGVISATTGAAIRAPCLSEAHQQHAELCPETPSPGGHAYACRGYLAVVAFQTKVLCKAYYKLYLSPLSSSPSRYGVTRFDVWYTGELERYVE